LGTVTALNRVDLRVARESSACCGVNLAARLVFGVLVGPGFDGNTGWAFESSHADCQVIARSKPGSHIAKWMAYNDLAWARAKSTKPREWWLDLAKGCATMLGMAVTRVPRRGERVRIEGHQGTLVVVRVDRVNNFASVELWDDPSVVLWDVPFAAIHLIHETASEAA
jgi:hypothetical protein